MNDTSSSRPVARRRYNHPMWLMIGLLALLLIQPAMERMAVAGLLAGVFLTLVGIASVMSVYQNRRALTVVAALGVPVIVLNWLTRLWDVGLVLDVLASALIAVFLLYLAVLMLANIFQTSRVTGKMLCQAVSAYLLLGFVWASAYECVVLLDPDAITGLTPNAAMGDYTYYSFITITGLGYGDFIPVAPWAKSLAVTEAVVGPLFLAILVARLAAMYRSGEQTDPH
ncbi:hypothetical protein LCGC14_0225950 [marine sediment metagenome]|uniref:Potassium channel domain-containing protein n=1 Tax=marine sediment metagenome TaxID=412755 RepID=A0A0F9UT17_9ZZZZ|nr:two pore domain potassium channel family protein [Phycisphaerae bacterium]HDZ42952.1 two pore domain potassium channel family protein [Phycisphaerae bacterium]